MARLAPILNTPLPALRARVPLHVAAAGRGGPSGTRQLVRRGRNRRGGYRAVAGRVVATVTVDARALGCLATDGRGVGVDGSRAARPGGTAQVLPFDRRLSGCLPVRSQDGLPSGRNTN